MWNDLGVVHKGACCITWVSWIVALLYAGACAFIVGYVSTNGLFTSDAAEDPMEMEGYGNNTNTSSANKTAITSLADMASQITTCKIKESADFAVEWAILIATSFGTWAIVTRPAAITFVFCVSRLRLKYCPKKEKAVAEGEEKASKGHARARKMMKKRDTMTKKQAESKTAGANGGLGMVEMTRMSSFKVGSQDGDLDQISIQFDNPMRVTEANAPAAAEAKHAAEENHAAEGKHAGEADISDEESLSSVAFTDDDEHAAEEMHAAGKTHFAGRTHAAEGKHAGEADISDEGSLSHVAFTDDGDGNTSESSYSSDVEMVGEVHPAEKEVLI